MIAERFKEVRKKFKLTQTDLAKILNVDEQRVKSIETKKVKNITVKEAYIMVKNFNLSFHWLVTGDGDIFNNEENDLMTRLDIPYPGKVIAKTQSISDKLKIAYSDEPKSILGRTTKGNEDENMVFIPQFDVSFAAGWGAYAEDHVLSVGRRAFSRDWIAKKGLQANKLEMVRVMGDSMEPLIKDKDVVMLDRRVNQPVTTMPIAFRLENTLYIKMCDMDGKGNIRMISINKNYLPVEINRKNPPDDFEIIGSVVWHAHSWI